MGMTLTDEHGVCRIKAEGCLTFKSAGELEDRIVEAMRAHDRFLLDLSGVAEIDLCGLHLLRTLRTLGGSRITTIATSPIVDRAEQRLLQAEQRLFEAGRTRLAPCAANGHLPDFPMAA